MSLVPVLCKAGLSDCRVSCIIRYCVKTILLSSAFFVVLITLLAGCKDTYQNFSPGTADPRIVGKWQLVERRFQKDSSFTVRVDTINSRRDTSFMTTKQYPLPSAQTLTFGPDGKLSAGGSEMTYYYPINYFRVDSTYDGLGVTLFISTNRANVPFRQGLRFRRDTLVLLPNCIRRDQCDSTTYLKFIRLR